MATRHAFLVVFVYFFLHKGSRANVTWSYRDTESWPIEFTLCGGNHQSPININTQSTVYFPSPSIQFINYDSVPSSLLVINTGHTLRVTYQCPVVPAITEGGLGEDVFIFAEYHFHWGGDDTKGSEHTLDNVRYPMELHLIHYNAKYGNMSSAATHIDGLAIMAILYTVSIDDNPSLAAILGHVDRIRVYDENTALEAFNSLPTFAFLLPRSLDRYYRYRGSITSPTCVESANWIIFDEKVRLSRTQLDNLRALTDAEGESVSNNFRPPQSLNNRLVSRSFLLDSEVSRRLSPLNALPLCPSSAARLGKC